MIFVFPTKKHDEAFLEAGILRDAKDVDEFHPWDLPEIHDFGPKWSGKIAVCFTVGCFFLSDG